MSSYLAEQLGVIPRITFGTAGRNVMEKTVKFYPEIFDFT